tara:strand:+ start:722 stop:2011 length:1290 start_codon:yes stop_codon:yes gene_type:complete
MGLWGTTTAPADKPKFLPVDSNAAGSTGAREHAIAVAGGWGLAPGLAASGNDNTAAQPEVLVCVKNLAEFMGSASIIGIDWTDATLADTGLFDITVTFDEAVDITSAAWSANQTITNKAYILLSRVGQTDMVEDSTMACMYFSGTGSNQIVFRGTAQTNAAAGYLAFNGAGVGETGIVTGINFDGTANMEEEDGSSALSLRLEAGTAVAGAFGGKLIANGSAGAVATVNGALSGSTTLVVDGVSGTLAVGQVITVQDTSTLAISDDASDTGLSTDNTLTITAVASQTSVTVSEEITVADNVVLLAMTNGGEEMIVDALGMTVGGPLFDSRADITTTVRPGEDDSIAIQLESGTEDFDGVSNGQGNEFRLVQETGNAASNDSDGRNEEGKTLLTDPYVVEASLDKTATFLQTGSTSGSAYILKGMDVAAS